MTSFFKCQCAPAENLVHELSVGRPNQTNEWAESDALCGVDTSTQLSTNVKEISPQIFRDCETQVPCVFPLCGVCMWEGSIFTEREEAERGEGGDVCDLAAGEVVVVSVRRARLEVVLRQLPRLRTRVACAGQHEPNNRFVFSTEAGQHDSGEHFCSFFMSTTVLFQALTNVCFSSIPSSLKQRLFE